MVQFLTEKQKISQNDQYDFSPSMCRISSFNHTDWTKQQQGTEKKIKSGSRSKSNTRVDRETSEF